MSPVEKDFLESKGLHDLSWVGKLPDWAKAAIAPWKEDQSKILLRLWTVHEENLLHVDMLLPGTAGPQIRAALVSLLDSIFFKKTGMNVYRLYPVRKKAEEGKPLSELECALLAKYEALPG